jgi:Protein of unknown function (DUF3096)
MQFYISLQPLIALIAGILILLVPRLLNYVGYLLDRHRDSWAHENVERAIGKSARQVQHENG